MCRGEGLESLYSSVHAAGVGVVGIHQYPIATSLFDKLGAVVGGYIPLHTSANRLSAQLEVAAYTHSCGYIGGIVVAYQSAGELLPCPLKGDGGDTL